MNQGYRVYKDTDRKREIFSTASLINRFNEGCPLDEIYRRGTDCYETLLDLIEKPEVVSEVSKLIKQPREKIEIVAIKIVNLLLLNRENNPFLSLGLPKSATSDEIKKRWKRLLMIYHPDRLSSQKGYEVMAKKINQVYREIGELQTKISHDKEVTRHNRKVVEKQEIYFPSNRYFYPKYLKFLPTFIIIMAISIAIFTIILLFIKI